MKVIVLGAGIIGVTSAYFLAKAGHEVVVIDKNSGAAMGCSYANGGQLSYSHIETWAAKNSLFTISKALFKPNSFLSISDFFNKKFLRWAWHFYKNSNPKIAQQNSEKLFKISSHSKEVMDQILKEEPDLKFNYKKSGILHFYRNVKKFNDAAKEADISSLIGCDVQILNAEECVKKEPTLVRLFDEKKLAGGIFYDIDASGDCFLFTKFLEEICREKYGVIFQYDADIKNILTNHKKITGINTSKGVFVADKYVYALGAMGDKLLSGIKIDSKIYPLKGYSLSIAANQEFIAPQIALTDPENKIVYSRVGNIFRAAGSIEVCGLRANKNKKHIEFLSNVVRSSFSDFGNFSEVKEWFGFRPFRANSIPLICEVKKYENFFINAGHGSLGWTLSAASGEILAGLVDGKINREFAFLDDELA